jgi:predicted O-methyltransferase YrrM
VSLLYIAKEYIKYRLRAKNLHGVHSPFVYHFNENVLNSNKHFYAFDAIENLRAEYLQSKDVVEVLDLGAGSHTGATKHRSIAQIAKSAARAKKYGELLFRIQNEYGYKNVLELGTSLGIGAAYIALANTSSSITSIEGASTISTYAQQALQNLEIANINYKVGAFDEVVPQLIREQQHKFDCVIIDGNHRYQPTVDYFNLLKPAMNDNCLFVFDDIYWSKEMTDAWQYIKNQEGIFITIDVFQFGLVFFNRDFTTKQHFTLKY